MRWKPRGRSANLEDRRGVDLGARSGVRLGLGGVVLLLILSVLFKRDFFTLLDAGGADAASPASVAPGIDEEEPMVQFVSFVLDDAQALWARLLREAAVQYRDVKLVLFRDVVQSACGLAQAASGPFYCPGDNKVYIDLGFYDELRSRFGAPGDFAQAYVLAHEIGHHVQSLLGIDAQVRSVQHSRPDLANEFSVRLELQADCYAGIWARSTAQRDMLEQGDMEEGLGAAAAVGDDRVQRMAGQYVNPDAFTHGSADQRVYWFRRGFSTGSMDACDTFSGGNR